MSDDYISDLQKEIERHKKDKQALIEELSQSSTDTKRSSASVIKEVLTPNVPEYIQRIDALALAADSESVRLAANKLLVEWAVTNKLDISAAEANDEFKDLLERLAKRKPQDSIVDPNLRKSAERIKEHGSSTDTPS